ncbi:hypothetical protein AMATHDRAFT_62892 [Amanita thiersii Skay4041]|uniref:DUF6535 domain-containing protein n=1 Tax=Amanita thiersii Skay4041 TaxID=703135 RepID=A0A2A9NJS0_9AGAR|nr:hypothetical protein AMATHDRAFT_62892 [Amanita thiersii Skay4041]
MARDPPQSGIRSPAMSSPISPSHFYQHPEQPWRCGEPFRYGLPKKGDPWVHCRSLADKYDKNMCEAWRDEVDKLLIFAGLFSSAVTAFTIESYKWLDEDPNATTAHLLARFLSDQANITGAVGAANTTLPSASTFVADASVVRINIFWFLSLTLSLTTVLIGTLCLQWLREFQRDAALPNKDALALRQMRFDSLFRWKVPSILAALPLLLQCAVVLFFAGVLDLLWKRNHVVAGVLTAAIGIVVSFMVMTTVLPFAQFLYSLQRDILSMTQCPYKSPQSWLFYKFGRKVTAWTFDMVTTISSLFKGVMQKLGMKYATPEISISPLRVALMARRFINWTDYDADWLLRREAWYDDFKTENADIVRGLLWVDATFAQSLDVVYSLYHCVRELHPSVLARVVSGLRYGRGHPSSSAGSNESVAIYRKILQQVTLTEPQKIELLSKVWLQKHVEHGFHLRTHMMELHLRCMNAINGQFLVDYFGAPSLMFDSLRGSHPPDIVIQLLMTAMTGLMRDMFPQGIFKVIRRLMLEEGRFVDMSNCDWETRTILRHMVISILQECEKFVEREPGHDHSKKRSQILLCAEEIRDLLLQSQPAISRRIVKSWEGGRESVWDKMSNSSEYSLTNITWDSIASLAHAVDRKLTEWGGANQLYWHDSGPRWRALMKVVGVAPPSPFTPNTPN